MPTLPSRARGAAVIAASLLAVSCGSSREPPSAAPAELEAVRAGTPVDVGKSPSALAVGGGALWVVDAASQTLIRVDAASRRAGRRVAVSGGPFAVALGEDAAWVAAGDGTISSYDLESGRPTGQPPVAVKGANGIAAGAGGVWVTSRLADTVTRVDPRTRRAGPPIRVGDGPADVAVGAGGVWVLNAGEGTVSRLDPTTRRAEAPISVGAPQARALAVGDNDVWVARAGGEFGERVEVVRIDPEKRALDGDPVAVEGAVPLDLATAAGSVWVTDAGDRRRAGAARRGGVARIDASRQRSAGPPLRTGDRPSAVAASDNEVWVANTGSGTVTPLERPGSR